MSVYCITSQRSPGCIFFDWTIHFLSGQENFYCIKNQEWIPLSTNPVQKNNAHGHLKNHPSGFTATQKYTNCLLSKSQDQLYSVYPCQLLMFEAVKNLNIPIDQIGLPENHLKINQYVKNDFEQVFTFCYHHDVKLIYVGDHPSVQLYYLTMRSPSNRIINGQLAGPEEITQERQQVFFGNSINNWNQLKLTNTWDQRERQALDTRPFQYTDKKFDGLAYPHMWVSCQDLWYSGKHAALKMLQYLNLTVVPERLAAWQPIYNQWQKIQLQVLAFSYNCQHIVDSIVNNWYYEIDLTFDQEVVIQHCLIYQHNLNLKTWQLEKFPTNTQDLHKLLEPNLHPVVPY